jgi:hypothetical protein
MSTAIHHDPRVVACALGDVHDEPVGWRALVDGHRDRLGYLAARVELAGHGELDRAARPAAAGVVADPPGQPVGPR